MTSTTLEGVTIILIVLQIIKEIISLYKLMNE